MGEVSYDNLRLDEENQQEMVNRLFFGPEIVSGKCKLELLYRKVVASSAGNYIQNENVVKKIEGTNIEYITFESLEKTQTVPKLLMLEDIGDGTKIVITDRGVTTDNPATNYLEASMMSAEKLPLVLCKTPLSQAAAPYVKEFPNVLVSRYAHRAIVADVSSQGRHTALTWFVYPGPDNKFWQSQSFAEEHEFYMGFGRMLTMTEQYTQETLATVSLKLTPRHEVTVMFVGGFPAKFASLIATHILPSFYQETCLVKTLR